MVNNRPSELERLTAASSSTTYNVVARAPTAPTHCLRGIVDSSQPHSQAVPTVPSDLGNFPALLGQNSSSQSRITESPDHNFRTNQNLSNGITASMSLRVIGAGRCPFRWGLSIHFVKVVPSRQIWPANSPYKVANTFSSLQTINLKYSIKGDEDRIRSTQYCANSRSIDQHCSPARIPDGGATDFQSRGRR